MYCFQIILGGLHISKSIWLQQLLKNWGGGEEECNIGDSKIASMVRLRGHSRSRRYSVATTSCKNVETLQRKNDLSCFKSLLVTALWDIILTSLFSPIQSWSSKFWAWSCIASNFDKGWRGITSTRSCRVSSTFATGCSNVLHAGTPPVLWQSRGTRTRTQTPMYYTYTPLWSVHIV